MTRQSNRVTHSKEDQGELEGQSNNNRESRRAE